MSTKKKMTFALQGGGAHGAFTWGVLDRMLEEESLEVDGLSGTSAGGMNAVAVAQGVAQGGNQGGREMLDLFWKKISDLGKSSSLTPGLKDRLQGRWTMSSSAGFNAFEFMSRIFSPYEMNPFDDNPLRDVVKEVFDFDLVNKNKGPKVFLCATHVNSGKLKVFKSGELKAESMLASACLPFLHRAVEVDGDMYWDGGFIGNPVFFPLIEECEAADLMLIQINPVNRPHLPTKAREIMDRLNEITSNASMLRELRAITFITNLIDTGVIDKEKSGMKRMNMHNIKAEKEFQELGFSSKLNSEWEFLIHLKEVGRKYAENWMKQNYDKVGKESTTDLEKDFM